MSLTFKICRHCGNLVYMVHDAGVPTVCCGQKMETLEPNTVDASGEKHVPAVTVSPDKVSVRVGTVTHPMIPEHFIQWICLETDRGVSFHKLAAGEAPAAEFPLQGEKPLAVYAYCNLHGLWKTEL